MHRRLALASLAALMTLAPLAACGQESVPPAETLETGMLEIEGASGRHPFRIELAVTPDQQRRGLMFRESLDPDAGMLFLHPDERPRTMWMRNTLIPLDMVFIAADGRVIHIHANAVPRSLDTIPSNGPAKAVLELAGGTAARLGLGVGDRVLHPAFGTAEAR